MTSTNHVNSAQSGVLVIRDNTSSEEDSTTNTSVEKHACYQLLLGRKQVVKLKSFRVNLINQILGTAKDEYLDSSLHNDPCVVKWYQVYGTIGQRKKKWSVSLIAHALCEFDTIMSRNFQISPMDLDDFAPSIQQFTVFMEDVKAAALIEHKEAKKSTQKKVGRQKGGIRTQDTIDITKLTISQLDKSSCASAHCRHQCLLRTGLDAIEINEYNEQLKIQFRLNLKKWQATSSFRRSAKPREGHMTSQELTCLCCRMNCLNSMDGSGCFFCEQACKNAKNQGDLGRPFFDDNFNCTCPICQCQCDVVYHRHEAIKLAKQTQSELEIIRDTSKQTCLDSFLTLKSDLTCNVKRHFDDLGGINLENAMSLASVDLVKSPDEMNANYERDNIQKAMGPLSTFVNDKSIAQLRRENRKSRYVHPSIESAHLPSNSSSAIISPPSLKTDRFYNNNLCTPVKEYSENAFVSQPSQIPHISSEAKVMKKQLIRRLINKASPPSDKKKKCFKALMNNDESALEIIDLAVEAGNSIEDTKDMILNYV